MTFPLLFSCAAERYALIKRTVIADDGCLTDDNAGPVIDKESLSDLSPRVNFDSGLSGTSLRNPPRAEKMPFQVLPVCSPVREYRPEARIKQDLPYAVKRRVPVLYDCNFFSDCLNDPHPFCPYSAASCIGQPLHSPVGASRFSATCCETRSLGEVRRHTACEEIPSPLPVKPRCSSVVALTLT